MADYGEYGDFEDFDWAMEELAEEIKEKTKENIGSETNQINQQTN